MSDTLINYEEALERVGGDQQFLGELLQEMVKQVDSSIPELEKAIAGSDFENLKKLAHGLKGASANLDVTRMVGLFKAMEESSRDQDTEAAQELLSKVKAAQEDLRDFVETL